MICFKMSVICAIRVTEIPIFLFVMDVKKEYAIMTVKACPQFLKVTGFVIFVEIIPI